MNQYSGRQVDRTTTSWTPKTAVYFVTMLIATLILCSCSRAHVETYPSDWPNQSETSCDCTKISGVYAEAQPSYSVEETILPGGVVERVQKGSSVPPGVRAFFVPPLSEDRTRLNDKTVKSREISIYFDTGRSLHLNYLIDGIIVSSKTLAPSDYVCNKGTISFALHRYKGHPYDKFPNRGTSINSVTIFRINDYLYVERSSKVRALICLVFPLSDVEVNWYRFLVRQPIVLNVAEYGSFKNSADAESSDSRFIANADGTVLDTRTNLMWAARDSGLNINWKDAKSYCRKYRGGGYTDWRMPTLDELAGLYDVGITNNGRHITDLIKITASAWASDMHGSDAAYFSFYNGRRYWILQSNDDDFRALPVRSINANGRDEHKDPGND